MTKELKQDLVKMIKTPDKDIRFDKNRIKRLEEINHLIRIVDESLNENCGGFLTYYTQKIKALSTIPSVAQIKEEIKISEEEKVLMIKKDREQKLFWASFNYHMEESPEFRKKAMSIIGRLMVKGSSFDTNVSTEDQE